MTNPDLDGIIKGVWFWDKRWWWVIAINELVSRKLKENPDEIVTIRAHEVNEVLDELGGTFKKRLKVFATMPARVCLKMNVNTLILKP